MTNGQAPAKILIVDDHPLVREGLSMRISLHPDLVECGQAASEDEALALVKQSAPDLVLIDISLKSGNGIDLIKLIKARHPTVKMLVLSNYDDSLYAERALRSGALGYLNKQESNEKVLEAIRSVLNGEVYVSPEITRRLVAQSLTASDVKKAPIECLSNRELEIFRMIGLGLTSGAIAARLMLSTHTIDTHRENIKRKLGVSNATELIRTAVLWVLDNH